MSQTIKNTVLYAILTALFLGGISIIAPVTVSADYDDMPEYIKSQIGELRDHLKARRDAYSDYRDAYMATKEEWKNSRVTMREGLADIRTCRKDPSPACGKVRLGFVETRKTFMSATVSRITNHLDSVDTYLVAQINDDDEKEVVLDWVNDIRTNLTGIQTNIDALTTESKREEVFAIRDRVKIEFRETRAISSAIRGHYLLSTAKKAQEKFLALGERFATELEELSVSEPGTDLTNLTSLIATYVEQVDGIQGHIDQASQLYKDIVNDDVVDEGDLKIAAADFKDRANSSKEDYRTLLASAKEVLKELHALHNK